MCIMSSIISSGQSRQEYAIDPQLKILSNFNPPVSKAIAPVASVFMNLMPKKIEKENIIYESFKVGDVKMHIMIPRSKADITQESLRQRIRFLSESFSTKHPKTEPNH